jgi:hypothetical protein
MYGYSMGNILEKSIHSSTLATDTVIIQVTNKAYGHLVYKEMIASCMKSVSELCVSIFPEEVLYIIMADFLFNH